MHNPSAPSAPQSLRPGDPVRDAVLQTASAPIFAAFDDRVRVTVERTDRVGPWVFVQGRMKGADGGRPDFSGTAYEKPASAGQMSTVYVALLKKIDDFTVDDDARSWRVADHAIGPSDVAWQTWPDDHAAPPALFGFRSPAT